MAENFGSLSREMIEEEALKDLFFDRPYEDLRGYLELLIYMAENFGSLSREMIEGVDSSEEALKDLFFDRSHKDLWDYLREELSLSEDEAYLFDCIEVGRCFDKNYQGNYNVELSSVIREFESNL